MGMFKSKKVRMTLVGIATAILINFFGLEPDQVTALYGMIAVAFGSFNIGQGVADGLSDGKTSSVAGGK